MVVCGLTRGDHLQYIHKMNHSYESRRGGPIISPPTPSHPAQKRTRRKCAQYFQTAFYPLVLIMYRKPRITRYLINPSNMEDENPALKHSLVETETIQT